jgi:hypothetical protein
MLPLLRWPLRAPLVSADLAPVPFGQVFQRNPAAVSAEFAFGRPTQ